MTAGDKIKLRAELAGKAMQGILSCPNWEDVVHLTSGTLEEIATKSAVKYADALIKELGLDGE